QTGRATARPAGLWRPVPAACWSFWAGHQHDHRPKCGSPSSNLSLKVLSRFYSFRRARERKGKREVKAAAITWLALIAPYRLLAALLPCLSWKNVAGLCEFFGIFAAVTRRQHVGLAATILVGARVGHAHRTRPFRRLLPFRHARGRRRTDQS